MEVRELKLIKNKDGHGTINYKICLPTKWIKDMGLTEEAVKATVIYNTEKKQIIIKKQIDIINMIDLFFKFNEKNIIVLVINMETHELIKKFTIDFIENSFDNIDELENYIKDTIIYNIDPSDIKENLEELGSKLALKYKNLIQ